MVAKKETHFPWVEEVPNPGTYRSLFKWGDPGEFKHPNRRLYQYLKQVLQLSDSDFEKPISTGDFPVRLKQPSKLLTEDLAELQRIVGKENVETGEFSRAQHCYGKTSIDLLRLRAGVIENPPDAVVHPKSLEEVQLLMSYCNARKIPIVVFGGGSNVTRGVECLRGGISLDMATHMKRILKVDPINQTATVEPGIYGPALETALNQSPQLFNSPHAFTCGHFPQSFEYSTVGGWIATRGAGQNSTYYGKIEDLVIAQKYITTVGDIITCEVPRKATGPDIDQVLIGSEGAYGILVEATLRVFRYQPKSRQRFSFIFHDWEAALEACREIMQGEFGFPSAFRLSDPEESDIGFRQYGISGTTIDRSLETFGYLPQKRCLLLGHTDGDVKFGKLVAAKIRLICKRYGALYLTGYITRRWEHNRFRDPYLRDDLGDFGILIDTLECGVNWTNLPQVWANVRAYCHSRPNTICMSHASHFYPQGTNLYFIFIAKMSSIEEYLEYQAGIIDTIRSNGGTLSHHHGIGKMLAPWLEGQIGGTQMGLLRALKTYFDPNNILNPGGTLGLDIPADQRR